MKEEELQQDMAQNEAQSEPLSLCRAWACSGKAKSRQQTEGGGSRKQACRVWPGRTPHWHLENDTQEEELQQDMAKS